MRKLLNLISEPLNIEALYEQTIFFPVIFKNGNLDTDRLHIGDYQASFTVWKNNPNNPILECTTEGPDSNKISISSSQNDEILDQITIFSDFLQSTPTNAALPSDTYLYRLNMISPNGVDNFVLNGNFIVRDSAPDWYEVPETNPNTILVNGTIVSVVVNSISLNQKVLSVNGKQGDVVLEVEDIGLGENSSSGFSNILSWFQFIWKLFTGFTFAELSQITDAQLALVQTFKCKDDGRVRDWKYVPGDTSVSNGGTVVVTSSGKRIVAYGYDYLTPENFGAVGDGVNDDTSAINNATIYLSSLQQGGVLRFSNKIYCATTLYLRKGCSWQGNFEYIYGSAISNNQTVIKNINANFQDSFVSLHPDRSFPNQVGEITGLSKNAPSLGVKGIVIDGGFTCRHTLSILESWGFKISNCKIFNAFTYSLNLKDCNDFIVEKNIIEGYLTSSNADYIETENDIIGKKMYPAYNSDRSGLGNTATNKIYHGGSEIAENSFPVTSINNGIMTIVPKNYLPSNPKWNLSGTLGVVFFDQNTDQLTCTTNGSSILTAVTGTGGALLKGQSYNLKGAVTFSGSSASRIIQFGCGNFTQQYGSITASNGALHSIDINFTFNPQNDNKTNPLKINILGGSGQDTFIFTNLEITANNGSIELNGLPLVLDFPDDILNPLTQYYTPSEAFYPKFTSKTTVLLYSTLSDYNNNANIPNITLSGLVNYNLNVPNCVAHFSGKNGHSRVFNGNKIEDVFKDGVVLRGVYNNNFSGNKISKGIGNFDVKLFSLIKGATKNTIISDTISSRINSTVDTTHIGIYADKYSGDNNIMSEHSNANYVDVFDEYEGATYTQNKYNENIGSSNSYIKKPLDYKPKKQIKLTKGKVAGVYNNTNFIQSASEFALYYKDVQVGSNITGDVFLFQQKDLTKPTQNGRFSVKITTNGSIVVTINSTAIFTSQPGIIVPFNTYDLCFNILQNKSIEVYVDGIKLLGSINQFPSIVASESGTISYIGSGEVIQGGDLYIGQFFCFEDSIVDFEIKSMLKINKFDKKDILLNSKLSGLSSFTDLSNSTISLEISGGMDETDCLRFDNSINNVCTLNLLSANINTKQIRVSGYIKSSSLDAISIIRKYTNSKLYKINNEWTKFSYIVNPNNTGIKDDLIQLSFGEIGDTFYGKTFNPKAGIVFVDYLKVYPVRLPISVFIDFSEEPKESKYTNNVSINKDMFTYFSGKGGFALTENDTNNSIILKGGISSTNKNGNDYIEVDGVRIEIKTLKLCPTGGIFSKTGNTLNVGTEGANSLVFSQSGVTKMQLFGSGNLAIGTSPTDTGDKLQVNGTALFTDKIKFSTGSNKPIGSFTLIAGTTTVTNSSVTTNSKIFVTRNLNGGTIGNITVIPANGSFSVTSSSSSDTSTFDYLVIN